MLEKKSNKTLSWNMSICLVFHPPPMLCLQCSRQLETSCQNMIVVACTSLGYECMALIVQSGTVFIT